MGDKTPVLKIDLPLRSPGKDTADPATNCLYEDAHDSVVQIKCSVPGGTAFGSGFVVKDDHTVITDQHVVEGSTTVNVIDSKKGKVWKAKIKDYDDLNDLAVLEIVGNSVTNPTNLKPVTLGTSQGITPDTSLYAVGHPAGSPTSFISPGYFVQQITEAGVPGTGAAKDFAATPVELADFEKFKNRPLVVARMHIEHGNSGGPLLNTDGKVVGVSDYSIQKDAIFTPVEAVSALVNRSAPKFNFSYSYEASPVAHYVEDLSLYTKAVLTGASVYAGKVTQRSSTLSMLAGAYGVKALPSDASALMSSTNTRDYLKHGIAITGDVAMATGLAVSVGEKVPLTKNYLQKAGPYGRAAIVSGMSLKISSEFVHNNLKQKDISRADGSNRAPFDVAELPLTTDPKFGPGIKIE